MIDLANEFADHIRDKYNTLQILLYCDNLAAHISNITKLIFVASKVFYVIFYLVL